MKISFNDSRFFDREAFRSNVFVAKEDARGFNALLVHCKTRHYKTKLTGATRVYLVIKGSGTFTINNIEEKAETNDLFLILDGEVYEYEGEMELFEFNIPATDSGNEEKLD